MKSMRAAVLAASPCRGAVNRQWYDAGSMPDHEPGVGPARASLRRAAALTAITAAHLALVVLLFYPQLAQGRVPFFRDVSSQYYPEYVFVAESLRSGSWPLWFPALDAGTRFLLVYAPDLAMLRFFGALPTLVVGPPLHILLGAIGASFLARVRGAAWAGTWAAGAGYGCSGVVLSFVNLIQLLEAAAWAPWVLAALARLCDKPSPRRMAALALVCWLQLTTLAADVVLQTALVSTFLVPWKRWRAWVGPVAAAVLVAALLSAPALLGTVALLEGSQRARGFGDDLFGWSANGAVLLEAVVPRLFGDVHTATDRGFWGQPYYTGRYPFLISLYVGFGFVLLSFHAPRRHWLWWGVALLGILLAAGANGPFQGLLRHLSILRTPVKYFWLTTLAVSMLAAHGLDQAMTAPRALAVRLAFVLPALLLMLGAALWLWPERVALGLASAFPALRDPLAQDVARRLWPQAFLVSGALSVGVAIATAQGGRIAALGGILAGLELFTANAELNRAASHDFYTLSPAVRTLLNPVRDAGGRIFTYGAVNSPGIRWNADVLRANSDQWLFYAERQTLWSRMATLDGFEPAFGEDRTGWAAEGATLPVAESLPREFARHYERLRRGGVRWVLSFHDLPEGLAIERSRAKLGFIEDPLRLYEIADPLPRAFWVPRQQTLADLSTQKSWVENGSFDPRTVVLLREPVPAAGPADAGAPVEVRYESSGPHEVRVRANTPPGFLVVLNQFDPAWRVEGGTPLLRANFRYWALPTPGGPREFVVRFRPRWRTPALALASLGALILIALVLWPARGTGY
jgi:hypothetical protein